MSLNSFFLALFSAKAASLSLIFGCLRIQLFERDAFFEILAGFGYGFELLVGCHHGLVAVNLVAYVSGGWDRSSVTHLLAKKIGKLLADAAAQ